VSTTNQAKYHTPEYRRAYKALKAAQAAGEWLWCVQPECVMPSRDIAPWQKAHVGHDDTGVVIIGPVHGRCLAILGTERSEVTGCAGRSGTDGCSEISGCKGRVLVRK